MKLSDYKNEDAIELLADLIEPTAKIMSSKKLAELVRGGKYKQVEVVKLMLKESPKECLEVLARVEGVPIEKYQCDIFKLTKGLLDLLSDPQIVSFFSQQSQMTSSENFGSVTESTEEKEQ